MLRIPPRKEGKRLQRIVTFWRGAPWGGFKWISRVAASGDSLFTIRKGRIAGLCQGCWKCAGPPPEFQGGPLEVELELRFKRGFLRTTEYFLAHTIRVPTSVVPLEVRPGEVKPGSLLQTFGATNAFLYSDPQDPSQSFLIDCGVGLVEDMNGGFSMGSQEIIPEGLQRRWSQIKAVVISHGHFDHWNLLAHKPRGIPIYCTLLVKKFLEFQTRRFQPELGSVLQDVRLLPYGMPGPLIYAPVLPKIQAFWVPHSVPETTGFAFKLGNKKVVHLSEFKFQGLDLQDKFRLQHHLRTLGEEGVDLLVIDTQNIETPGFTPSEEDTLKTLGELLYEIPGRVVVTCFSSNLQRIQWLAGLASAVGRNLRFVGTGMRKAQEALGDLYEVTGAPRPPLVLIPGCQAEEESALSKEAYSWGWGILNLGPDDTLVFSSRAIPGNEARVRSTIQAFQARGIRVIVNIGESERLDLIGVEEALVHASGHASQEDVKLALQLLRPKCAIPWPPTLANVNRLHRVAEGRIRVLADSTLTLKEVSGAFV